MFLHIWRKKKLKNLDSEQVFPIVFNCRCPIWDKDRYFFVNLRHIHDYTPEPSFSKSVVLYSLSCSVNNISSGVDHAWLTWLIMYVKFDPFCFLNGLCNCCLRTVFLAAITWWLVCKYKLINLCIY